jgi:hypothetical protein
MSFVAHNSYQLLASMSLKVNYVLPVELYPVLLEIYIYMFVEVDYMV